MESKKINIQTAIVYIVIAGILGLLCAFIPPYFLGKLKQQPDYYPFLYWIVENSHASTGIFWFLVGIFLGYKQPKIWFIWGLAVISLFPILTIYETIRYPKYHNLFPFEIIMYAVLSIIPFLGSLTGRIIKNKKIKSLITNQSIGPNPPPSASS